ncbi:hypothetical protein EIP91_001730 [Steccherinum ochraceum]|uniref:Uncharacterized protein n=1 Tax=Steccherinum ochraceum TaxID=92696 RepID=A0A4R0RDF9_9APHY|nr:hypothetical protein EIP91_001730 [Steccherinum ochraceum]
MPPNARPVVVAVGAPPTLFGERLLNDNSEDILTVKWPLVAAHEPKRIVEWIVYLHRRQHDWIKMLLPIMDGILATPSQRPRQWKVWAATKLPCILMDILLEEDMFAEDESRFTNIRYSFEVLATLHYCLTTLMGMYDVPDTNAFVDNHDRECAAALLSRMERFVDLMWTKRHLIPRNPGPNGSDPDHDYGDFLQFALHSHKCMLAMCQIYDREHQTTPPPTFRAAQFLVYYWTYTNPSSDTAQIQKFLHYFIQDHRDLVPHQFIRPVLSFHEHFLRDFTAQLCRFMRDERFMELNAKNLLSLAQVFVDTEPKAFSEIELPGRTGLIPSLITCCQRQTCSSYDDEVVNGFTMQILDRLVCLPGDEMKHRFGEFTGDMNFIGILARSLPLAARACRPRYIEVLATLFTALKTYITGLRREASDDAVIKTTNIYLSSACVWHDTLDRIKPPATNMSTTLLQTNPDRISIPAAVHRLQSRAPKLYEQIPRVCSTVIIFDDAPLTHLAIKSIFAGHPDMKGYFLSWETVAEEEAEGVVQWLCCLHKRQIYHQGTGLLRALTVALGHGRRRTRQFNLWKAAKLPSILIDILLEPDVFRVDGRTYKAVEKMQYCFAVLTGLNRVLSLLVGGSYHIPDNEKFDDQIDQEIAEALMTRMEAFCELIWNERSLTPKDRQEESSGSKEDRFKLSSMAFKNILFLTQIYWRKHGRTPPPTMRAAHFLAYYWVYNPTPVADVPAFFHHFRNHYKGLPFQDFVRSMWAVHDSFADDFMKQISLHLTTQSLLGQQANLLLSMCHTFIKVSPEVIARVNLLVYIDFLQDLLICCIRQMCSSPAECHQVACELTMQIILLLIPVRKDGAREFGAFALKSNFIRVLTNCAISALKGGDIGFIEAWIKVIDALKSYTKWLITNSSTDLKTKSHVRNQTNLVWHDTFLDFMAIHPTQSRLQKLKADVLVVWKSYGAAAYVYAGFEFTTLKRASEPSDVQPQAVKVISFAYVKVAIGSCIVTSIVKNGTGSSDIETSANG